MKNYFKIALPIFLAFFLLIGITEEAFAGSQPNTHFMHPYFGSTNNLPSNVTYSSDDIWFEEWSKGNNLCLYNLRGIDSVIDEAVAHTFCLGKKDSSVDIFTEEADPSAANINALYSMGWVRMDLTYKDWRISYVMQPATETLAPRIYTVDIPEINDLMASAGFEDKYGTVEISGNTIEMWGLFYYEPDFHFLKTGFHAYKYHEREKYFEYLFDGYYSSKTIELYYADYNVPGVDGTYLFTNTCLPDVLLSPCTDPIVIDAVPDDDSGKASASWSFSVQAKENENTDSGTSENIWSFLDSFDSGVEVYWNEYSDVRMDLNYSGALPEGTEITVSIPDSESGYEEGTILYLYYCNPETALNEYSGSGIYEDGHVTFDMSHCSEYIITSIDHGDSFSYESPEPEETASEFTEEDSEAVTERGETSVTVTEPVNVESAKNQPVALKYIVPAIVVLLCGISSVIAVVLMAKRKKK